jgi:hypothetical protein
MCICMYVCSIHIHTDKHTHTHTHTHTRTITHALAHAHVQASGLLDGMLQWLMQHFDASAPGPGGVRPVDIEAGGDDAAPPLDECVDVRARMLDNDAKAWRRMTIDMVCLFARMLRLFIYL